MKKFFLIVMAGLLAIPGWAQEAGRNQFFGLGGTAGASLAFVHQKNETQDRTMRNFGMAFGTGLDWAYPVSDKFGVGLYFTLTMGPNFFGEYDNNIKDYPPGFDSGVFMSTNFRAGVLFLVGDVNKNPFIIGLAPFTGLVVDQSTANYDFWGSPLEVRFGRVLNNNLYVTGNLTVGAPTLMTLPPVPQFAIFLEPSVTIGYNFGPKLKKVQKK